MPLQQQGRAVADGRTAMHVGRMRPRQEKEQGAAAAASPCGLPAVCEAGARGASCVRDTLVPAVRASLTAPPAEWESRGASA